jgi:hypothetical protein
MRNKFISAWQTWAPSSNDSCRKTATSNYNDPAAQNVIDAHSVFEVILILGMLHLQSPKRYNANAEKLTSAELLQKSMEVDALCDEWARGAAEPLAPKRSAPSGPAPARGENFFGSSRVKLLRVIPNTPNVSLTNN